MSKKNCEMMKDQKSCIFRLKNEMQIQTCFLSASLTLSLLQSDLRNNWQICQNFPAPSCKKKLPHLNIPQSDQCGSSLLFLRQILLFQCDLPEVFLSFFQDNTLSLEFFSRNQMFDICDLFSVNSYAPLFNGSSGL